MNIIKHLVLAASLTLLATTVSAQSQVRFQNIAQKEVSFRDEQTGELRTRLEKADLVKPGETVIFTSIFTNISDEAAENVQVNNPIPENMVYIPFSASGIDAKIVFSVDGETFKSANNITVIGADGRERTARAEEYKEIQWVFESQLAPGESGEASFKARLQ